MSKLKSRLAETYNNHRKVDELKEYNSEQNLNWRDDGDELNDPSINDYLKGYNIDPYEFKQWAKIRKVDLIKQADRETVVMKFTPSFLGDRILTLWNGIDGSLQRFFEAFTLRYNNKMKMQIASYLEAQGYKVFPVLTDDKPIYAKVNNVFKKVASSKNLDNIMAFASEIFRTDDSFMLFVGELADLKESGMRITASDATGLLSYYNQIFPENYAIKLVTNMIENPDKVVLDVGEFKDYNISDKSLEKIEDYMSGNADPTYIRDGGSGGYDFVSDMRSTDGTAPGLYEVRTSKKKD